MSTNRMHLLTRHLWAVVWVAPLVMSAAVLAQEPADDAPAAAADLTSRLETMMERLDKAREQHHVPGLGIAVVLGNKVLLCEGLGQADIEKDIKASGDTVFAIGSSTKAFTATAVGILVDEGKMDWDDHVREHLPDFHVLDETADEKMTIRDLLCHRTGLSRMGVLWAAGRLSREEILEAVAGAEPSHTYGEEFNYSNINYIAAGHAAGKAFGSDWETLVEQRLFAPLEMTNTTLRSADVLGHPKLATGYYWDDVDERFVVDPMRNIDTGSPAGSIGSSARDMANWLRFQLDRGAFEGTRIISKDNLTETWSPQVSVGGSYSYGLGWLVGEFEGRRIVEHGGNIDGFAAHVAFLPDDNLGFVLLANVSFTPLQGVCKHIVLGTLLEDTEPPADETHDGADDDAEDFGPYLGNYVADFGPFKDTHFTVLEQNSNLAVDVPGQMVYELEPPDDEGRRAFAITDEIAISFDRGEHGQVVGMRMFQDGLTFELPREGIEIKGDVDFNEVRDLLGTYHFKIQGVDCQVLMNNGRLAIDVPNQMVYELHPPDDEGTWVFRATDDIAIKFNRGDDGDVESLTMYQAGMEFEMPRTAGPDPAWTATLDEVMALHQDAIGGEHIDQIETLRLTGSIRFVNQGVTGTITTIVRGVTDFRDSMDLGRNGQIVTVVAGDHGWSGSSFDPTLELKGKYLRTNRLMHPLNIAVDWRTRGHKVELEGIRPFDDRPHYVVRIKHADEDPPTTVYIDVETGTVSGNEFFIASHGVGMLPMHARFSNYRDVAGVMLPARIEVSNDFYGKAVLEYDTMKANVELPADAFDALPEQIP